MFSSESPCEGILGQDTCELIVHYCCPYFFQKGFVGVGDDKGRTELRRK